MLRQVQSITDSGLRQAIWLIVPSFLVTVAAFLVLPWLLETRRRLDNDDWEAQLYFAAVSLGIAAGGVPFVILRLFRRVPYLCLLGWLVATAGYLAMTVYMVQSHFPVGSKFIFGSLGAGCLLVAVRGLAADIRGTG